MNDGVRYLVFDIETVADGELIARIRYANERLDGRAAVSRYRAELMERFGNDFIPQTFHLPVSVAVAKVAADFRLIDLVTLDVPRHRPHVITEHFWRGWELYRQPTWVSFNGRGFDLPVMEQCAFRFGISVPRWFNSEARSWDQSRNRYNIRSHVDLQDLLTNFGATKFTGGLHLAANWLGKPGKMDVQGFMVQDLFDDGRLDQINDYCKCDTLDTYFVFLRSRVLIGELTLEDEHTIVSEVKQFLEERAPQDAALAAYLERWGDWTNPWSSEPAESEPE